MNIFKRLSFGRLVEHAGIYLQSHHTKTTCKHILNRCSQQSRAFVWCTICLKSLCHSGLETGWQQLLVRKVYSPSCWQVFAEGSWLLLSAVGFKGCGSPKNLLAILLVTNRLAWLPVVCMGNVNLSALANYLPSSSGTFKSAAESKYRECWPSK